MIWVNFLVYPEKNNVQEMDWAGFEPAASALRRQRSPI